MKDFEDFHDKTVIFAGDFNLIFDKNLESAGAGGVGEVLLRKHILSKIIKLNEAFNLWYLYVILIKNYSLSDKKISLLLYNEDLIIFSFLTIYKNQLKKRNSKCYIIWSLPMIKSPKVQKSEGNVNGINMEKNLRSSFWKVINTTVRHLSNWIWEVNRIREGNPS